MKLRLTTALAFILIGSMTYAGASDSLNMVKATSHFQFLIGNYVGQSFNAKTTNYNLIYSAPGQPPFGLHSEQYYSKPSFTPMYSYSFGFDYKADLTKHIGVRTGINYFTYAYIAQGSYNPCTVCDFFVDPNVKYKRVVFMSSFHIPAQILVYKPFKKGRFIFSVGPDIYLPINTYGKETLSSPYSSFAKESSFHSHVNGSDFFRGGSMGFSLGFGYEKILSKKLSIELMPDIRVMNLVPFDFQGQGTGIYKNYIFNTTVGLSTYLSFNK